MAWFTLRRSPRISRFVSLVVGDIYPATSPSGQVGRQGSRSDAKMIRVPVSRFSVPLWAPLLLFLCVSFLVITHTSLIADTLQAPAPPPFPQPVDIDYGRLARQISAKELLDRPLARNSSTIPRIYHQSWMSSELPTKFQHWTNLCRSLHADWEWVLWTDEDNENLVRKYFPWLLESFLALPAEIYRADFSRSLYMYAFGG